ARPTGLDAVEHALLLVLCREVGVVAPPRAAGLGEDEDALLPGHEGVDVGVALRAVPPFFNDLLHATVDDADEPPAPSGHLRYGLPAEAVQELVEDAVRHRYSTYLQHQ